MFNILALNPYPTQQSATPSTVVPTPILPTYTTVLGSFSRANHEYKQVHQFLRTPGAGPHFAASMLLPTINTNPSNIHTWATLDSGSTNHFLVSMAPRTNVLPENEPLRIKLPGGAHAQLTHAYTLVLPQLPVKAHFGIYFLY